MTGLKQLRCIWISLNVSVHTGIAAKSLLSIFNIAAYNKKCIKKPALKNVKCRKIKRKRNAIVCCAHFFSRLFQVNWVKQMLRSGKILITSKISLYDTRLTKYLAFQSVAKAKLFPIAHLLFRIGVHF